MPISKYICALTGSFLLVAGLQADEAKIAYLRLTDGFWQVWLTDPAGDRHVQVSFDETDKTRVSWMPNRKALVCNVNDGRIQRISADGKHTEYLTLPVSGMFDAQVSPDGKRLAFSLPSTQKKDNNSIWMVGIDGKGLRKLTNQPELEISPSWRPDGAEIVYSAGKTVEAHELWQVSLKDHAQEQLTAGTLSLKVDPAVSPAGVIAYSDNQAGSYDIWVLDKDGGKPARITDMPEFEGEPSWSPDGKALAFSVYRSGENRIWVSDNVGKGARPVTPAGVRSRSPVWAP